MGWESAFENLKTDEHEGAFRTDGLPIQGQILRQLAPADANERVLASRLDERAAMDREAKAWWASQVFLDLWEREEQRQRELHAELREVEDRDFFDHIGEGWKAATTVVGGGVGLASLAGAQQWSPEARTGLAVVTGVTAAVAGYSTGRKRSRKEAARVKAAIGDSERAVAKGRREVGMVRRMVGAYILAVPPRDLPSAG